MTFISYNSKKNITAQTAVELAVFGAILIFVLGLLVRQAFNANFIQNHSLRAMRVAMSESFKSAHGFPRGLTGHKPPGVEDHTAARNVASVLFLEDRLTPATGGKYGPITRTPFAITGTASFSQNIFLPVDCITPGDWGCEDYNLPRMDVIINGQRFTFTLAGFNSKTDIHQRPPGSGTVSINWIQHCAGRDRCDRGNPVRPPSQWVQVVEHVPCAVFYKQIPNFVKGSTDKYCWAGDSADCANARPPLCNTCENLPADQRFDLDRDPQTSRPGAPPGADVVSDLGVRENFSWQWYMIKAFSEERSTGVSFPSCGGNAEENPFKIDYPTPTGVPIAEDITVNKRDSIVKNNVVDVDQDGKEEVIVDIETAQQDWGNVAFREAPTGVITAIHYIDNQEGDLDLAFDQNSAGPRPGLQEGIAMYTTTKDGTFLRIEEGKLFTADTNQYVRSVQKRDRVDIIERTFQLSNDTGHFCGNGTIAPNGQPAYWDVPVGEVNRNQNPFLEACNNCFAAGRGDLNCFEEGSNLLYIRTRVADLSGRKWVTEIPEAP